MRVPNDRILAKTSKEVDLMLGGHDHIYYHEQCGDNMFIKSGSDFKHCSLIEIEFRAPTAEEREQMPTQIINDKNVIEQKEYYYYLRNRFTLKVTKYDIKRSITPLPELTAFINECYEELDKQLGQVICYLESELDTTFSFVRTQEAPIGNFIADLMRKEHNADIGFVHSGTIRADKFFKQGFMTIGDWNEINPFKNGAMLLEATGAQVLECLENSVSKLPALEGRFLQVLAAHAGVERKVQLRFEPTRRQASHPRVCADRRHRTRYHPSLPSRSTSLFGKWKRRIYLLPRVSDDCRAVPLARAERCHLRLLGLDQQRVDQARARPREETP